MSVLRTLLALSYISLATSGVIAQQSPVVITGAITDVKFARPLMGEGERTVYKNGLPERNETHFEIHVRLTYHNRGDETFIVPNPRFFSSGTSRALFLNVPAKDAAVVETAEHSYGIGWVPNREWIQKVLESAEPGRDNFHVLEPGGFFEHGAMLIVKSGFRRDVRKDGRGPNRDLEVALPEFPYFKLQFSSAIRDKEEDTEPLRDAQRRWRKFGKLLLTSNGSLFFETEVIINKLPE